MKQPPNITILNKDFVLGFNFHTLLPYYGTPYNIARDIFREKLP